jgi:YfiH family protein
VSDAPYDGSNLGDHVGDNPAAVAANRALLAETIGLVAPEHWCWMQQVHAADVAVVRAPGKPGAPAPVVDALVTAERGLPLAVVTADCAPIALACDDAVGVVHAGHRGLLAGVVERAVASLREIGHGEVRAVLGPCIRAPRYEFGARDLRPLVDTFGASVESRTEWGTQAFDISAAVAIALARAGVDRLVDIDVCTSASSDYFSYRRDGRTGRQATIVMLP